MKIEIPDEDKQILADMLGYAISRVIEMGLNAESDLDLEYFLHKEAKFMNLEKHIRDQIKKVEE